MNDWKSKCISLLGAMNSQRNIKEQIEVYSMVLDAIGQEFSLKACQHAVLREEWRPSPAKLRQIAVCVASPYPSAEECYAEIMDKAIRIGSYGVPHPERPNIFLEGPPPMSHPLVSRIVPHLGGWRFLCEGEAQMQEGLKKQVSGSHATVSAQWEEEVAQQLVLPPSKRNPIYFGVYKPYRLQEPLVEREFRALPPPPKDEWDLKAIPPPAPVLKLIECIGAKSVDVQKKTGLKWFLPEEDAPTGTLLRDMLSKEDREFVETEAKRIREKPEPTPEEVEAALEECRRKRGAI